MTSRAARLLAAHAREGRGERAALQPGATLTVFPDRVVLDEDDAARVVELHAREGRRAVKHPERLLFAVGAGEAGEARHELRRFARRFGLPLAPEPRHCGAAPTVAADLGLVGSDHIVLGLRPEAGALGGLGALVLKSDLLEISDLLLGRPVSVAVPPVQRVTLTGRLPRWTGGFDLALEVLSRGGGRDALAGRVLEFDGPGRDWLDVPARLALCGTLAAAGLPSLVRPDAITATWLAARGDAPTTGSGSSRDEADVHDSPDVSPNLALAGQKVPARVSVGAWPGRALAVGTTGAVAKDAAPSAIHEVLLAGRLEALRAATELLRERNVKAGLDLCVIPDSQRTLLHAVDEGLVADLLRAGAALWSPGRRPGPPRPGVVRVSCHPGLPASVYASPELAAACAVDGKLMHPEVVMRLPRRGAAMA